MHQNTKDCIQQIYKIVGELEARYPGRHFTPDGHLVGSLGEVYATEHYDLELNQASTEMYDATTKDGKRVQIKTTQGNKVGLSAKESPEHLLVLKLDKQGNFTEIYNGPGEVPFREAGKATKTSQKYITLAKLASLMASVPLDQRI